MVRVAVVGVRRQKNLSLSWKRKGRGWKMDFEGWFQVAQTERGDTGQAPQLFLGMDASCFSGSN